MGKRAPFRPQINTPKGLNGYPHKLKTRYRKILPPPKVHKPRKGKKNPREGRNKPPLKEERGRIKKRGRNRKNRIKKKERGGTKF